MNMNEIIENQKPAVFIKKITFNDDTQLPLAHNSIVVFTGANNSGKSQILKDLRHCLDTSEFKPIVIKKTECEYCGSLTDEKFLNNNFSIDQKGQYIPYNSNTSFPLHYLNNYWTKHSLYSGLHSLFINRLSTEMRLKSSDALFRNVQAEKHPIFRLCKNESLAKKLSNYFYQAFKVDLVVNQSEMQTIPLHIGQAPNKKEYTIDKQDEYYAKVSELPKLQDQGDGMRSFASILLDTFTSEHTITLIDEPEAFLHPPQARLLGKMLAKNNSETRQLFISTHSEDFLQGLLDADNQNVIIIRINRNDNINHMNILKNEDIKKLWGNPLLRYSNILSGLFHEKVIVCESDYDCLFYQAIMDAICEDKGEIAPDLLFTHCGGKYRVKDVVGALLQFHLTFT